MYIRIYDFMFFYSVQSINNAAKEALCTVYLGKFRKLSQGNISNIFSLMKGIRTEKVFVFHNYGPRDEDFTFDVAPFEIQVVTQVYSSPGQTTKLGENNKQSVGGGMFSLSVRCPNSRVSDTYALWIPGRGLIYSHDKSERSRCKGVLEGVSHWVQEQEPEIVNSLIDKFVKKK